MLEKLKCLKEVAFFEGTELEESGRREKCEEAEVMNRLGFVRELVS